MMNIPDKPILIPVDFSEHSEFAFQHALVFKAKAEREILLLHIVKKDAEIPAATEKLKAYAENLQAKYNIGSSIIVKKGDIFKTIKTVSVETNAMIIIMGMHSAKRARKVIIGSTIPFLLIQMPPINQRIIDIVVPVDYDEKSRNQVNWIILLSSFFGCNINLMKPFFTSKFRSEKMKKNMFFIKSVLDSKEIVYGVRTAKRDDKFKDAIFEFANEIEADLIFIMSYQFKEFILKANKVGMKIPILCINPATNVKLLPGKY